MKENCINSDQLWNAAGKPRAGDIFKKRNYDRNIYRKRIKEGQCGELFSYTNDLHDALLNKSGTEFWKSWRVKFGVSRTAHRVDGLTNDCDIAVKFANYFEDLCSNLNSVRKSNLDDE